MLALATVWNVVIAIVDCADQVGLAEFWAAMLGGEFMFASATTVDIRGTGCWLSAMKVPDPGTDVACG